MDQLNEYLLHTYPDNYITGKDDCNLLIWGTKGENRHTPKLLTLLIGFETPPYGMTLQAANSVLEAQLCNDTTCKKLYGFGKQFSEIVNLPFLIIVYPSMRKAFNGHWEDSRSVYDMERVNFYFKDVNNWQSGVVSGSVLRHIIYDRLGQQFSDTGTNKDKNKQIADYFHLWSRDCLSASLAKFDIDGFLVDTSQNNSVMIEIKRSHRNPYIPEWYPKYDKPDYLLQFSFASAIGAKFWLLHHELGTDNELANISFFDIKNVLENENTEFLRFNSRIHKLPLIGEISLDTILQEFFSGSNTRNDVTEIKCPMCGHPIKNGCYGFYCGNNCKMQPGKVFGDNLSKEEIRILCCGERIIHAKSDDNRSYVVCPIFKSWDGNGDTTYYWKAY